MLAAGAQWVHFDVMDNHYVPNLTIGPLICEALRKHGVTAPIDVHLMVKPVDRIVPDFAKAGATNISFHPEASEHIDRTIGLIHDSGCTAGLVFNPATPLAYLDYVLDKLDLILLMSVNPGFGGQSFIPSALDKLRQVRERIDRSGRNIRLEIDGGVKVDNIAQIAQAGADTFVAGSAIFGQKDYRAVVSAMRAIGSEKAAPESRRRLGRTDSRGAGETVYAVVADQLRKLSRSDRRSRCAIPRLTQSAIFRSGAICPGSRWGIAPVVELVAQAVEIGGKVDVHGCLLRSAGSRSGQAAAQTGRRRCAAVQICAQVRHSVRGVRSSSVFLQAMSAAKVGSTHERRIRRRECGATATSCGELLASVPPRLCAGASCP